MKRIAAALTILLMSLDTLTAQNIPSSTTSSGESTEISALFPTKEAKLRHDVSAYLGSILGTTLHEAGMRPEDLDFDILIRTLAIELALQGQNIPEPEANETRTQAALRIMRAKMEQRNNEISATNAERSRRFLEENAKKPGIVTTPSGLQYRIDKQGTGKPQHPEEHPDVVYEIKYTLRTLDGTLIGNAKEQINKIRGGESLLEGLDEALGLMPAGSRWTLYIPSSLGFGDAHIEGLFPGQYNSLTFDTNRILQSSIPGNSTLIMTVDLLKHHTRESAGMVLPVGGAASAVYMPHFFWCEPHFAVAGMRQLYHPSFITWPSEKEPDDDYLPDVDTHIRKTAASQTAATILAEQLIDEGFILADMDMDSFRSNLRNALSEPPSLEQLGRQYPVMQNMERRITERDQQTAAQTWLRSKRFMTELLASNRTNDTFWMPSPTGDIEIPCKILADGKEDREIPQTTDPDEQPNFYYLIKYIIRDIDGRIIDDQSSEIQEIIHVNDNYIARICAMLSADTGKAPLGFKGIFYVPPSAGFGEKRVSVNGLPIPGNSLLIVELEFLGIKTSADF